MDSRVSIVVGVIGRDLALIVCLHRCNALTRTRATFVMMQWEETENKSTVITYVAGATAAVWLSSTLVGAINAVPLLPKIMELVGLGYSTWFVYRYVLFKDSRKELMEQVDALVSRVSGDE